MEQKIVSSASLGVTPRTISHICRTDLSTAAAESRDGPQQLLLQQRRDGCTSTPAFLGRPIDENNVAEKRANYLRYEKIL